LPWTTEEKALCASLISAQRRNEYRALWKKLACLDELSGCPPGQKQDLLGDCMELINALFMDKKDEIKGQYYDMRLTSIAGGAWDESFCDHKLSAYSLMYGEDVVEMRLEILRWGKHREWGTQGVDRYTVGEYNIRATECELHVFNLPSIIQSSDQDSGMFLGKGWASVLIHARVLIGCILGKEFKITCAHDATAHALTHYGGLCERDGGLFIFSRPKMDVAHRALYLLLSKILNPKNSGAMYQLRMNGLVDTRDQYHDLIV
jgi:hypothetical protein